MEYQDIVRRFGSGAGAITALGIPHRQYLQNWKKRGIPLEWQIKIELATNRELLADVPPEFRMATEASQTAQVESEPVLATEASPEAQDEQDAPESPAAEADLPALDDVWWESSAGVSMKGAALGIEMLPAEKFNNYRLRVFHAAGNGPWMFALDPADRRMLAAMDE